MWLSSRLSAALAYVMLVNALAFTITGCVSFSDQLNMLFTLNGRGKISLVHSRFITKTEQGHKDKNTFWETKNHRAPHQIQADA